MNPEQRQLWEKIKSHRFDRGASSLTFAARLAQEQGWTRSFTEGAIEEYRRFLFLCATADQACTPSKVVDEVWHAHLTFTRNYWHDLCRDTLGIELHHDPSSGQVGEEEKFREQFAQTLATYDRFFGAAPVEFWGNGKALKTKFSPAYLLALPILMIAGCSGGVWLLGIVAGVIGIALYRAYRSQMTNGGRGANGSSGGSCTTSSCGTSCGGDSGGDSGGSSCGSGCGGGGCGGGGD
ncbi:hypothetical protein EON81_25250 [bacterium]|nr:MAG: hypothetical protein EON81_25250 [bacterium]